MSGGKPWEKSFAEGLMSSRVVIPICSWAPDNDGSVGRMVGLTEDSPVDYVLLEWEIALELFRAGRVQRIFPLMLGSVTEEGCTRFPSKSSDELPDVVNVPTKAGARVWLEKHGVAVSNEFASRTVKGTVVGIMAFHGIKLGDLGTMANVLDVAAREVLDATSKRGNFGRF